jgi:uncharacterized surface protein with fasciclin (FAS1) repeats
MKTFSNLGLLSILFILFFAGCAGQEQAANESSTTEPVSAGQSAVQDDESQRNVVQVAVSSPDHSTLVTAVQAAGLVDVLSNAGPFTVFAPVNGAFDALPDGTVESLLEPENKAKLQDILEYHVFVGVIQETMFKDGRQFNQVNLKNVTLGKSGEQLTVNGANITGVVRASNGVVYIIDKVLLPE